MKKTFTFVVIVGVLIGVAALLVCGHEEKTLPTSTERANNIGEKKQAEKKRTTRSSRRNTKNTPVKAFRGPNGIPMPDLPSATPPPTHLAYPDVFPASPEEMGIRLLEVSSGMGKEGLKEYTNFMDTLKVDREVSAAMIHEALEQMPTQDRFESDGRKLVFALGELAHKSSMPALQEILDEPLPPFEEIGHHYNPQNEAIVTRGMVLDSMLKVTDRYQDPETVGDMYHALNDLLEDPETSTHIAIKAARILQKHADDPAAEAARQAALLGPERQFIASVEFVHELPPTDDE